MREFPNGRAEILTSPAATSGGSCSSLAGAGPGRQAARRHRQLPGPALQSRSAGACGIRWTTGRSGVGPGDVDLDPQGHDGWVVGDEPVVVIELFGASDTRRAGERRARVSRRCSRCRASWRGSGARDARADRARRDELAHRMRRGRRHTVPLRISSVPMPASANTPMNRPHPSVRSEVGLVDHERRLGDVAEQVLGWVEAARDGGPARPGRRTRRR